jgi:hypothetical protein
MDASKEERDAASLKDFAGHTFCLAAKHVAFTIDGNFHCGQVVEVAEDICPFHITALAPQAILQFLA